MSADRHLSNLRIFTMNALLRLASVVLLTSFSPAIVSGAEAVLLTGKSIKGAFISIDPQFVTIKPEGEAAVKIGLKELATVDLGGKLLDLKPLSYDQIELTDGSLLRAKQPANADADLTIQFKGKKVSLVPLAGPQGLAAPQIELPLTTLSFMQRNAHDSLGIANWKATLAKREKRDSLVIITGGTQQRLLGTVLEGNEAGDRITFEDEKGEKLNFALARVNVGLTFNQPPRDVIPPTICKVLDTFGNTLVATSMELTEQGVKVMTVSGASVEYPTIAGISKLDFSQSNVSYLTSLTPKVLAPEDLTELALTFTADKTRLGKVLQVGGKSYNKGLSIFGGVTLIYNLGGDYRELKTVVGVDDGIEVADSKVKLSIIADGRSLFSDTVSRKDKPRDLILDVKDVKELKIVVERDNLFFANSVNLCEIRVQK